MNTKNTLSINQKSKSHNYQGFTLVELIVVITILIILGTIAFTRLTGFSGNARDSSRTSDFANIAKGLDIAYIKTGSYPNPDGSFSVTYSGGVLWTQGTIGDTVVNILGSAGSKLSKKPTDPLTTAKEYTYSKLTHGNAYQLKTDWEWDSMAYIIPQTYASSGNPTLTYIKGNYNGIVAKTETGSMVYLLAVPSLITTGSGALDPAKFLIHGQTNSGGLANAVIASKLLVYSSGSLPSNDTERILFASSIALAYSGTALASQSNIASYITALRDTNTGTMASLWGKFLSVSLGGSTSTVHTAVITYQDCTFNATPITHSTSVTAYQTASVSFGNTCISQQRTCTDGTLSGTYTFANCTVDGATGTFTLSQASVTQGTSSTISNNCSTAPTSYTSSDTAVATIAGTTITTLSVWTTNITPVWGACGDNSGKTLTVTTHQYPWCTTPDILVGWKYWAACNVGATTISTSYAANANDNPLVEPESKRGKYFQWWENIAWDYDGGVTSTDNCTWDRDTQSCTTPTLSAWSSTISDTTSGGANRWYDWGGTATPDTRGPCALNYHVPTQSEWNTAYTTLGSHRNTFISTLKLPTAGYRAASNGALTSQGSYGGYWSSSSYTVYGYNLSSTSTSVVPMNFNNVTRATGFSVRCLKN
ncbi:MAG: hypothetical protein ACD_78C00115G0015 [uncultured bacterium (gcode 4)]|uniref:Fibrobacter succinogenes major paralogous domain-containing protein n=1 Tax=uncultured bacterium (gcode 4) TaxID=1234023 RepID=K1XZ52_9BACT|nr:MAG: hypothetical protein ACD_78C00115G0015 [uncultured bacterium (gcode 4)]